MSSSEDPLLLLLLLLLVLLLWLLLLLLLLPVMTSPTFKGAEIGRVSSWALVEGGRCCRPLMLCTMRLRTPTAQRVREPVGGAGGRDPLLTEFAGFGNTPKVCITEFEGKERVTGVILGEA